jgi:hypothetical protein
VSSRTPRLVAITGTESEKTAADAAGDTFRPGPRVALVVANRHATIARTVMVVVPGNTKYDQPNPDIPIVIAAGAEIAIGPFPDDLADPADGLVHVTYPTAADLWIDLIELSGRGSFAVRASGYGLVLYGLGGYGD